MQASFADEAFLLAVRAFRKRAFKFSEAGKEKELHGGASNGQSKRQLYVHTCRILLI